MADEPEAQVQEETPEAPEPDRGEPEIAARREMANPYTQGA